jgi:carboxypeptidase T
MRLLTSIALGVSLFANSAFSATIPNYPCYRQLETAYESAQKLVDDHPNLATWTDIGDSWEKTAGEGGHDMMVLKITNKNIAGAKPKLFISSEIHAREFATAELTTRYSEHLLSNYGKDADVTWMLDHHEIHFLLFFNPDGRKKAEPNVMWRKNTNRNYCGKNSKNRGVDMNRNFDYQWGNVGSSSQCNETYRGPRAASEPEVQAVQNYMRSIFEDRRDDDLSDPAPRDYQGIYIDIHSYGEIIYQPRNSPNDRDITTLNRRMAFYNGYRPVLSKLESISRVENTDFPKQASENHDIFNHTYSFGYGDLGVPSYLIELGTAFFQRCSYFESNIVPKNFGALTYALKSVRAPYITPAGPETIELKIENSTLSGIVDDGRLSTRSGRGSIQNIKAAEYYIDTPPWSGGTANAMASGNGRFGRTKEPVNAALNLKALSKGRHIVYVRGQDADDNWGPFSAVWLEVK